ncbi:MAG: hypothetical protein JNL09_07925 [Anaerolineales bacterium]|nr:hypothetical protein [Anaerolineales bacterium]
MQTIDTPQTCVLCGGTFTVRAVLEAAEKYWPWLDVVFATRPCCGGREELQLRPNVVWCGYLYAAGAPHYAAMEEYAAPGLTLSASANGITFMLDGREVQIPEK